MQKNCTVYKIVQFFLYVHYMVEIEEIVLQYLQIFGVVREVA